MNEIIVREARREDLEGVNVIRKQVHQLHLNGRPDMFRGDGWEVVKDVAEKRFESDKDLVIAAAMEEEIVGFALIKMAEIKDHPVKPDQLIYHVEEFGVDENHKRMGIGRKLMHFIREDAKRRGYKRVDLDVWAFNKNALAFYESIGFETFRRYVELWVEEE